MATKALFRSFLFFFLRFLLKRLKNPRPLYRKASSAKLQKYPSLKSSGCKTFHNKTLLFDVEGALLRSSSPFPYFMSVAFEAGGPLRALLLLLLYPLLRFCTQEIGLKVMVMVCFCGVRVEGFRVGRAVLPKLFLEDVGLEVFEVLERAGKRRRVAVTELPKVMVEGFLKEYLEVEAVVGRELKVAGGYYVGLMDDNKKVGLALEEVLAQGKMDGGDVVGIGCFNKSLDHFLAHSKEIYMVTEADKRTWHPLPRERYPRPLIFHDGRLAIRPDPLSTLFMFLWVPFGFFLAIFRFIIVATLPFKISTPILAFSGMILRPTRPKSTLHTQDKEDPRYPNDPKGILYVCNHRTLVDPLYVSFVLNKSVTAVTYSLSRVSEILSPIKTVRLSRDRDEDKKRMEKLLGQGDLVVCPEGTTCREPFLLRFSPLFAEVSENIVPVAINSHCSLFYGTTAGGFKCLDPLFFLMNPFPGYDVKLLDKVPKDSISCGVSGRPKFEVANHVQGEIGKALGFECTQLTRKDKYLMLAGNEGIVPTNSTSKSHGE